MTLKNFYKKQTLRYKVQTEERRKPGILVPVAFEKKPKDSSVYKTEEEIEDIHQALAQNEFLKHVLTDKSRISQLVDRIYGIEVHEGTYVVEENQTYNKMFIFRNGMFEISENGKSVEKFIGPRIFGEVIVAHPITPFQSIKALEKSTVWILHSYDFNQVMIHNETDKQDEIVKILKNVPKIQDAPNDKLYKLADLFEPKSYEGSSILIKEGDIVDTFMIVTTGSATVLSRSRINRERKLFTGDFFGEKVFFKETASAYTVIPDSTGIECLEITRQRFLTYFHDIEDFLHKNLGEDQLNHSYVKLRNLKKIKTLGRGGFGKVELVQDVENKENLYALKYLRKCEVVGKSQIQQVYNEKDLQMQCSNPFIVKLYQTFKDSKYIYFLQEPCMGGDLWNLLRRQKTKYFDSEAAKFYAGCIVEAFGYLHARDIVYRDLKPENVMVCDNGYIKITDFGFAKKITSQTQAYSFVGTAEYISPELIQSQPHDKGVDYWALGIFIFELLAGYSPFKNNEHNDEKTYKAILKGIDFVSFPYIICPKARNLIKKLCKPLSIDRLGCQKDGIKDIQNHPWFSKLDWQKLRNLELEPPIRICLTGKTDTRYFDCIKEKEPEIAIDDFSTWDSNF